MPSLTSGFPLSFTNGCGTYFAGGKVKCPLANSPPPGLPFSLKPQQC